MNNLNYLEITKLLEAIKSTGINDISEAIETVKKKKLCFEERNRKIEFLNDTKKSSLYLEFLTLKTANNNTLDLISKIELDNKNNLIIEYVNGKIKKSKYNDDINVTLKEIPLKLFLQVF